MRLPVKTVEHYTATLVTDAKGRIIMRFPATFESVLTARALVRDLNRNWRYVFLGQQPYDFPPERCKQHWLFERNTNAKAP